VDNKLGSVVCGECPRLPQRPSVLSISLKSIVRMKREELKQVVKSWHPPSITQSRVRSVGSHSLPSDFDTLRTYCAVVGNACGTVGILHSVLNSSTIMGGPVALSKSLLFLVACVVQLRLWPALALCAPVLRTRWIL
jgi:hypothetical protein